MTSRLAAAGLLLGLTLAAAPVAPAAAAECSGLAALLSSCVATAPSPQPAPLPVTAPPAIEAAPTVPAVPVATEPVLTPAPAAPAPTAGAGGTAAVPAAADRLLQLVNEARAGAGLAPLTANARAASIAAGHSTAMAQKGDIFHNPAYFTAATRSSLGAKALGENVAMNGSLDGAHQRLMASPGHRANILDGGFDSVGIGVVRDAGGTLFITQNFVDSAGTAAAVPAPKAVAKPVAAPLSTRPAAAQRVAAVPAAAPAGPAAGAVDPEPRDAVLSAGGPAVDPSSVDSAAAGVPGSGSPVGLVSAAALALLGSIVGAALRVVTRP